MQIIYVKGFYRGAQMSIENIRPCFALSLLEAGAVNYLLL